MGSDGINSMLFQILVGDAGRQWLEVHYFKRSVKPLGKITKIIPKGPNHPEALLDACIAFFPDHFHSCLSLPYMRMLLATEKCIDFDVQGEPLGWNKLRQEALPLFKQLSIWEATLKKVEL